MIAFHIIYHYSSLFVDTRMKSRCALIITFQISQEQSFLPLDGAETIAHHRLLNTMATFKRPFISLVVLPAYCDNDDGTLYLLHSSHPG